MKCCELIVIVTCGFISGIGASTDCFMRYPGKALYGHNDKVHKDVSIEQCKNMCLAEVEFVCLSFDYTEVDRMCFLSSENTESQEDLMGRHFGSLYFERISCPEGECNDNWFAFSGQCYHFAVSQSATRAQAQSFCEMRSAHLVAIETEQEYNFIASTVGDILRGPYAQWWTAGHGTRTGEDLNWAWEFQRAGVEFKRPMDYQNWMPQYIRDRNHDMNAVLLTAGRSNGLLKVPDSNAIYRGRHAFICEKSNT